MTDFRSVSPSSDVLSDGMDSLSIRDKSLLKRSISKHHNNNFKAGYVPVHEQYLNKTGLRGRKTFAFWTLVFLIFILAIGNLILTIVILGVLRLGQGMQSLELIPDELAMKFIGDTDLGNIYKRDGKLEGFWDIPVEIIGDNGSVFVNVAIKYGRSINKFKIDKNDTIFRNIEHFEIKSKRANVVFSTSSQEFRNFKNLNSIHTRMIETNRIVSPINKKLSLEGKSINLKGAEGTRVEGREVNWSADQDIHFQSNNSILISGEDGIFVDVKKMPISLPKHADYTNPQYKVCICMPQGKLFKLHIPNPSTKVYCNQVAYNPCM
ncbi:hypothetical protein ILUMI_06759 [Ignelater luminosus]|uniref:Beta-sarcoglycan n=1 Tax=Ignelater luminosus TaxID=2038154 RepID=A0A8K0GC92_IGNLU|nr:hypothetical protein ILUMI_06759 [Ignelater luminosus]